MESGTLSSSSSSSSGEGEKRVLRQMIKLLVVVIFLGYCMIWIMVPTNTYRRDWLLKIRAKANSTYFGSQGAQFLIYNFPVLFVAFLGCIYLHYLGKKQIHEAVTVQSGKTKKWSFVEWKKPVLVKGPLGIVSAIELVLFLMFIALLVWSFSTYVHNSFATITPKSLKNSGRTMWEAKLDKVALRLGLVGNICLAFLFFPVVRGSSILPLFGLTSESCIKYHIWLGHIVMLLFTSHGFCYVLLWASTHEISEMVKWEKVGVSNIAGELALVAGLIMWATTIPRIRRKMFELFLYSHYLYIPFMFFFILHVGISYAFIALPGFYLFLIDRYLRFLQSRRGVRLVSARILPCDTLELDFSKNPGLKYNPTSTIFVNVPSISKLQWHPFTISSSSSLEPEKLSVIIKSEGTWSQKLYQMFSSTSSEEHVRVSLEGPYGPASSHFFRHDMLVMVSGGSGITPFISVIRELIYASSNSGKTPKVLLISSFKNSSSLTMLDLLLPISSSFPVELSKLDIQIEAYVTREKVSQEENQGVRTIWFKPNISDAPISAILGPKSWLWLSAIISSSFVMYLILVGLLTRYYIYPIEHNTNKTYPTSSAALLNMLLICGTIAITASGAFLWNKRKNGKDANQINVTSELTPAGTPNSSWSYKSERELESLPQQSLVQATNVYHGARPDLKSILFNRKESSVGVLVCGPKKMRREVATICSSGLADNLHFESISFSW